MTTASNQDIPRKVAANQGFHWVAAGFRLYRKTPLLLSAAFGLLFGVVMALGLIPMVGGALSELASPLMVAGFLAAYRALDNGDDLELPQFLAGVQGPAVPLMAVIGETSANLLTRYGPHNVAAGLWPPCLWHSFITHCL